MKSHWASNPPSAGSPPHQCPQPGGGTWKPKSTAWDHTGNKSTQVFHMSGWSRCRCTHITLTPVVAAQHGSNAGSEMPHHGACMQLVSIGPREWPSLWITVSYLPGYILSPATRMSFASSIPRLLSRALACCRGHGAPAVLSLRQPALRSGWIDFANTHLQTQFFLLR